MHQIFCCFYPFSSTCADFSSTSTLSSSNTGFAYASVKSYTHPNISNMKVIIKLLVLFTLAPLAVSAAVQPSSVEFKGVRYSDSKLSRLAVEHSSLQRYQAIGQFSPRPPYYGQAPNATEISGEYSYSIFCYITPQAPALIDLELAVKVLDYYGSHKTCPNDLIRWKNYECLDIMAFRTVDIELCHHPKTGIPCGLVIDSTKFVAKHCERDKRAGGWAIVTGPGLRESGIKVLVLE
jgi:hypothetical protein